MHVGAEEPVNAGTGAAVGVVCPGSEPSGETAGAAVSEPTNPAADCWTGEAAELRTETGATTGFSAPLTGESTRATLFEIGASVPVTGARTPATGATTAITGAVMGERTRATSLVTGARTPVTGARTPVTGARACVTGATTFATG